MSLIMKTIKNNILAFIIFFGSVTAFSGCYTVLWTPEDEFPEERVSQNSSSSESEGTEYRRVDDDRYYQPERYGVYTDFYYSPWWTKVRLPQANRIYNTRETGNNAPAQTTTTERGGTPARDIRNTDNSGRTAAGRTYNSGSNSGSSTSGNSSSNNEVRSRDNSGSGSSSSSGNSTYKEERKSNTDSAPKAQSSSSSPSREKNSGDSNSLRNSDGNRSTEKGRR